MKKIFRTNKTTIVFSWSGTLFCLFSFFLAFFILKNISIGYKLLTLFGTVFMTLFTLGSSFYELIIDDETITSKNDLCYILPFLSKYITYRWDEIERVIINATIFFEETAFINIFPKDASRKRPPLTISFISGIPASAAQEILSHIPKDAEVKIDPALKKYIENPRKMYRYNVTLGIIIAVIIAIWTFWIFTFHNPLKSQKLDFRKAWQQTIEQTNEKYKK